MPFKNLDTTFSKWPWSGEYGGLKYKSLIRLIEENYPNNSPRLPQLSYFGPWYKKDYQRIGWNVHGHLFRCPLKSVKKLNWRNAFCFFFCALGWEQTPKKGMPRINSWKPKNQGLNRWKWDLCRLNHIVFGCLSI